MPTVPPTTKVAPGTIVAPSTSAPSTSATVHWLDISFAIPAGWTSNALISGKPQNTCLHPAVPSPEAPRWFGCTGIWVVPWTSDPSVPAAGSIEPGQVWFMGSGALPCPYPSSQANNVVLNPGTLVAQQTRTVGGVSYRWYEWTATCNLKGTAGSPVTHTFDAQVWWLPSSGIAFADVADQPGITTMLGSVEPFTPPPTTTTTTPGSFIAFHSPTGNIHCAIQFASNTIQCFTASPPEAVTLAPTGSFTTCTGEPCLGAASPTETDLAYGQAVGRGPFQCTSALNGVTCTVNGKGFEISRSGIVPS